MQSTGFFPKFLFGTFKHWYPNNWSYSSAISMTMSSQPGGIVARGPIIFLATTKITVGKKSVGKSTVHPGKLKQDLQILTINKEYDIDKKKENIKVTK